MDNLTYLAILNLYASRNWKEFYKLPEKELEAFYRRLYQFR